VERLTGKEKTDEMLANACWPARPEDHRTSTLLKFRKGFLRQGKEYVEQWARLWDGGR
jgi:hypothetical protein